MVLFIAQLCRNAQKWANKLANEDIFIHQINSPYGENLYSKWSSIPIVVRAKDAFFSWYNEGKNYDYSREPKNQKAGNDYSCTLIIKRVP